MRNATANQHNSDNHKKRGDTSPNFSLMLLLVLLAFSFTGCVVKVPIELHDSYKVKRASESVLFPAIVRLVKAKCKPEEKKQMFTLIRNDLKLSEGIWQYIKENVETLPDKKE